MQRLTLFGLPATLVLDCGEREIRIDNWVIADAAAPYGQAINYSAIADAITAAMERDECH